MTLQPYCGALARLHWHSPDEQLLPIALSANVSVVVLCGSAAQAARHAAIVCDTEGHLVRALQRRHDALTLHSITCRVMSVWASSDLSPPRVLCSAEAASNAATAHETLLDDMHCGHQDAAHALLPSMQGIATSAASEWWICCTLRSMLWAIASACLG